MKGGYGLALNEPENIEQLDGKITLETVDEAPATSCKGCVFADAVLGTQYNCQLGRLQRFRKTCNLTQEDGYYIIDGRMCNAYRPEDWAKNFEAAKLKQQLASEIALPFSFIIYFKNHTLQQLETTLKSCNNQTLQPREVILLNHSGWADSKPLTESLNKHLTTIKWRHSKSVLKEADRGYCFDMSLTFIKGKYFGLVDAGYEFKNTFIEQLNTSLNERLDVWLCLDNKDCVVAQTKLTQLLSGFQEIKPTGYDKFIYGIPDKIKYFAEISHKENMVQKLEDYVL